MNFKLTYICLSLTLLFITTPAFSHSGHTSIFHSHSGIEYFLALFVIGGIIYHYIKK